MLTVFYIVIALYALLIFRYFIAWITTQQFVLDKEIVYPENSISVIIAFRNEAHNLETLIGCLKSQSLPPNAFQVILINDHSTDNSYKIAVSAISNSPTFSVINSPGIGKKEAIAEGLKHARGKLIVTSDADCTMQNGWLASIANFYLQYKPKLIIAPVAMRPISTIWQGFQALEFQSLIASGAGAALAQNPIMCNGANLAFEAELVGEKGFDLNKKYASGDDMFLLEYVKKQYPKQISFIKNKAATVFIAPETINTFFKQRKRWVSKSGGYKDFDILYTAFLVLLSNLILMVALHFFLFEIFTFFNFLSLYLLKAFFDFLLIAATSNFFSTTKQLILFVPLSIVYPFYLVYTAFFGLVGEVKWKGRTGN